MLHLKEVLNQDFPGLIQTKEISYDLSMLPVFPVTYPYYLLNSNSVTKNQIKGLMQCTIMQKSSLAVHNTRKPLKTRKSL